MYSSKFLIFRTHFHRNSSSGERIVLSKGPILRSGMQIYRRNRIPFDVVSSVVPAAKDNFSFIRKPIVLFGVLGETCILV